MNPDPPWFFEGVRRSTIGTGSSGAIRVLHVGDDPDLLDVVAGYLERENDAVAVATVTNATAAPDRLRNGAIDCVASDYRIPDAGRRATRGV